MGGKNRSPGSFKILQAYSIYGSRIQHDEDSLSRQGSIIEKIDDIGTVQVNMPGDLKVQTPDCIENADIIAVKQLGSYSACINCKGRVDPLTPPGGRCSRRECGMFQRIDKCTTKVSAQLFIEYGVTGNKKSTVFGPTGWKHPADQVTARDLILRPTFDLIKFENDVITTFTLNEPDT